MGHLAKPSFDECLGLLDLRHVGFSGEEESVGARMIGGGQVRGRMLELRLRSLSSRTPIDSFT